MLGIDVVDVERLRSALERRPLETRLFSKDELEYCNRKVDPVVHLAGTLAAKEAVIKALALGRLVSWAGRIEIVRESGGAPVAVVKEGWRERRVPVSITHDAGVAAAVALRTW